MKPALPYRQEELLAFIDKVLAETGTFPTIEAMRNHMGWLNNNSVHDCLVRLGLRGAIKIDQKGKRDTRYSRPVPEPAE